MVLTSGSHTSSDVGRSLDPDGIDTLGLNLLDPHHKEVFLEEPKPQVLDGPRPFREEISSGPKGGPSTAPLELDPFFSEELSVHASRAYLESLLGFGK